MSILVFDLGVDAEDKKPVPYRSVFHSVWLGPKAALGSSVATHCSKLF